MKKFFDLQRFATKKNLTKKADTYENSKANMIIYGLAGNDSIANYADKVTIFGGAGADSIWSYGSKVKISGDAGKDYIYNSDADSVSIDGGTSADQIQTRYSDHVTINGGAGNDSIQLGELYYYGAGTAKNTVIKYASGDGNDTIFGFDSNDTLYITEGTYSTSVKGNDFIVTVGKQKIILKDAVGSELEKVIIKNSKGKLDIYQDWKTKTIENATVSANNVTIKAPKTGSYITNYGDKVNFVGNNGVDQFFNSGNNSTISGGKGKDIIYNGGDKVSISGGADDDEIGANSIGNYVTVNGGKGNDYVAMIDHYDGTAITTHDSYKTVVQYANGDGNDTILGFNSDDTLQITKGSYSVNVKDTDVIVTVGKGSITLKDAAGQNISIKNSSGKVTKKFYPAHISLSSGNDNYTNQTDNIIIYALGGNDSISNFIADNVTVFGGNGNDTFSNGWSDKNIYFSGDKGDDSLTAGQSENVTLSGGAGADKIFVQNNSKKVSLVGGAGNDTMQFSNYCESVIADGSAGKDYINSYWINFSSTIMGGKGNDTINLNTRESKNNLIKYASGDGNDTILGFDSNDTLQITSGTYSTTKSGSDFIVKVGKQKITLKDAVNDKYDKINIINSSGELVTYNAWSKRTELTGDIGFVNTSNKVTLTAATKDGYVGNVADQVLMKGGKGSTHLENNYGSKVTMVGGISSDRIYNTSGKNVKISGGAGDDYISSYGDSYGYTDKASINGGAGNDEIYCSWSSNNTIIGGKGNDLISVTSSGSDSQNVFKYASGDGNDTIYGFGESDTLKITSGTYKAKASGSDVVVTVGKGKITLIDAAIKKISITDSSGKTTTKTYGSSSALFTENNFVTADNLSSIVKNGLTATDYNFDAQNFETLTQQKTLITYSNQ